MFLYAWNGEKEMCICAWNEMEVKYSETHKPFRGVCRCTDSLQMLRGVSFMTPSGIFQIDLH